ncbi:ataxin-10 isoform X2 [Aethina tumida]|uniref:ataxin-10 isoform X2 n=1 Tax=Aethina tumida TaxID=116153 RepID=UPI00214824D6|nr:ataxin-10 isoform X2 [Aethina tumida]
MSCTINPNFELLNKLQEEKEWDLLSQDIHNTFKLQFDRENVPKMFTFNAKNLDYLESLLIIQADSQIFNENLLIETLKAIRNSLTNSESQKYLSNEKFLSVVRALFNKIEQKDPDNLCFKILLQLLINLVVQNPDGCKHVFQEFSDLSDLLLKDICIYEVSALLYNISIYVELNCFNTPVINNIFNLYGKENKNEYLLFLIEKLLSYDYFWDFYENLEVSNRILCLHIIREQQISKNKIICIKKGLDVITKLFINSSEIIFNTTSQTNDERAFEISLMLQILSHITAVVLINIHRLGKTFNNCFTQIQKQSDVNSEDSSHPAFGFKGDLVRLIGNMNWKCKKMQDLTREAEIIPVILECCNIDARNPFIMQWSIFAIRNICENNVENQKIIGGLSKIGTVSNDVLKKSGITLHADGSNQVNIVNLEDIK